MLEQAAQPSLYERLGGIYSIACVVDDFIDRVMTDPPPERQPSSERSPSQGSATRLQISGYRNGRLGQRRPAEIYRAPDARVSRTPEHHAQGMGGVHGRFSTDTRQVQRTSRGTRGTEGDRQ
jgi:hypothetical protein